MTELGDDSTAMVQANQRNFALNEHRRILFITLIGAIVFSSWDTFKKIWVELERREQKYKTH